MTYSFHPEARIEFKDATIYYSGKNPSLGSAFHSEVESAIKKIVETPELYRVIEREKCLNSFKFLVPPQQGPSHLF